MAPADAADPLNARVTLGLMRALDAAGDRAAALQMARAHEEAVRAELDAPPDPAVLALAAELKPGRPVKPGRVRWTAVMVPDAAPQTRRRRVTLLVAMLAGVAVLLIPLLTLGNRVPAPASELVPGRVAVAVFVNRTGSEALDPLGTMASDWVTRGLAATSLIDVFDVGGLYVAGRSADGAPADPRELARANGAGIVVAGNYYRADDRIMFSAQVIDVATGNVLRAIEPIGAASEDPLPAVEELRRQMVVALHTILDPRASAVAEMLVPPRYDAFQAFITGQDLYWRGNWDASLPWFRRAASLDTSFTAALAFVGVVGVGTARCDLADSVLAVFESRPGHVPETDMLTARVSVARCVSDHMEHNRLLRRRAALMPGSKAIQFFMSTGFRQVNRPAEALAILNGLDPSRDLGWLPERGRSFYWREVSGVLHALGEHRAQLATAQRMRDHGVSPLAVGLVALRGFVGLGMVDSVFAALDAIRGAPADPALLSGITGGLDPVEMASPGWVMVQAALELAAHGHDDAAQTAALRSIAWFRSTGAPLSTTRRFFLARALELTGELAQAREILDDLAARDSSNIDFRGLVGVIAARQGDDAVVASTDAWLASLRDVFPPGLPTLYRAALAAMRGEADTALDLLEALPQGAHPHDFLQFHLDPAFASLRSEPRFRRILTPKG